MPALIATLGTSTSGKRHRALSLQMCGADGTMVVPLDDVSLAACRVGRTAAARLWSRAVRAIWRIAADEILDDAELESACRLAAKRLASRLPDHVASDFELTESHQRDGWVGEIVASTARAESECFASHEMRPTIAGYSQRLRRSGSFAVGSRVSILGDLDGEVIDITSHRLGGGVVIWVRRCDGQIVAKRHPDLRLADPACTALTSTGMHYFSVECGNVTRGTFLAVSLDNAGAAKIEVV